MNLTPEMLAHLKQMRQSGIDLNAFVDGPISAADKPSNNLSLKGSDASSEVREIKLNSDQEEAFRKIRKWLKSDDPYFALRGAAGTGKSTLMRFISELNYNFHFSAPTNKASKVLAESLNQRVKTTYSLLGAKMEAVEEKKELTINRQPDLGSNPILVIDEAGMVPKVLINLLRRLGYRVLFVGDPAQLNPVGETISGAWKLTRDHRVTLKKIERFDNQLLKLSKAIRQCLKHKRWSSPLVDDNDGKEGVFLMKRKAFERDILSIPLSGWDDTKLCVWRNSTVDDYTTKIRDALGFKEAYEVGERLLLASPLVTDGMIEAYTDEEFVIHDIHERVISMHGADIETRVFNVGREFVLHVPVDEAAFTSHKSKLAAVASASEGGARKAAWSRFWEFSEAFSHVRYGYALTAHRLQGSTHSHVFLDQSDILANPNKAEAYRALYVGATRPRFSLKSF